VITGGEPTIQKDLIPFLEEIKSMKYSIKLDTNGSHPHVIKNIIKRNLVDYFAMDVKAPYNKYSFICGMECDISKIRESVKLIIASGINHEFRTTLVNGWLTQDDLKSLAFQVNGAKQYKFQRFVKARNILNNTLCGKGGYSKKDIKDIQGKWGWDNHSKKEIVV